MNIVKRTIMHFHVVNKHRWFVFYYSIKAGIPIRGLLHDLSKYSPTEFFESVKYFDGHKSPITVAKINKGYSEAWLHHKGRNKHHIEYWEDIKSGENKYFGAFMPYKYLVESLCDRISAGRVYNGKNWSLNDPINYWKRIERDSVVSKHPGVVEFIDIVLTKLSIDGVNKTLKPKYLKKLYKEIYNKYY